MPLRMAVCLVCAAGLTGCVSPESTRTRGNGPGADTQNRPAQVRMHEGSQPFWDTPVVIEGEDSDLDPAQHARRLSLQ